MITSIKIKGYRGFSELSIEGLGRVNLLVGKNNTGKSSILEALTLLGDGSSINSLWQLLARRGEYAVIDPIAGKGFQQEVDVGHIFCGHRGRIGSTITIETTNDLPGRSIKYELVRAKPEDNLSLFQLIASQESAGSAVALKIISHRGNIPPIPLTERLSLRQDVFSQAVGMSRAADPQGDSNAYYITTDSANSLELQRLWNDIALKPEEDRVVEALRIIDPKIERIAPVVGQPVFGGFNQIRGSFFVRRDGEDRIPIGSLGDGLWRMFALAVILIKANGGLLLIDEIDTGLHHTVMEEMWRFINTVSKENGTQVFATTHSNDCVHALASICSNNESASDVTIHRIEANKRKTIPFSESEIRIAADRNIEIR